MRFVGEAEETSMKKRNVIFQFEVTIPMLSDAENMMVEWIEKNKHSGAEK